MVSVRRERKSLDKVGVLASLDTIEFERRTVIEDDAIIVATSSSSIRASGFDRDSVDDIGVARDFTN